MEKKSETSRRDFMKISGLGLLATGIPLKATIAQTNSNTEYLNAKPLENFPVNGEARWMWPAYPGANLFKSNSALFLYAYNLT